MDQKSPPLDVDAVRASPGHARCLHRSGSAHRCNKDDKEANFSRILSFAPPRHSRLFVRMSRVKLSSITALTLHRSRSTTSRRTSPVPQLTCVGAACSRFQPDIVQCTPVGSSGGTDIEWRCEADLPSSLSFGSVEVSCEGWDGPSDPYVLKGSCGLTYNLVGSTARFDDDLDRRYSSQAKGGFCACPLLVERDADRREQLSRRPSPPPFYSTHFTSSSSRSSRTDRLWPRVSHPRCDPSSVVVRVVAEAEAGEAEAEADDPRTLPRPTPRRTPLLPLQHLTSLASGPVWPQGQQRSTQQTRSRTGIDSPNSAVEVGDMEGTGTMIGVSAVAAAGVVVGAGAVEAVWVRCERALDSEGRGTAEDVRTDEIHTAHCSLLPVP